MVNKLKQKTGETLAETLVSVLVIGLAMIMLAGGIISSARMNKQAEDLNTAFQTQSVTVSGVDVPVQAKIVRSGGETPIPVKLYTTNDRNEYCYYEVYR